MPIYTRTGDDGTTGLFGNQRVAKDHARIEAYGTVDELSSTLGVCAAELAVASPGQPPPPGFAATSFAAIQSVLFDLGADLATVGGKAAVDRVADATRRLEAWIDESEALLPALRSFVLPGGTRLAALLHVSRTVARRAERRFWTLCQVEATEPARAVPTEFGVYLNRLSDLCFSWARLANRLADSPDVPWLRE
ncbi:MAG: cob(I)yrinic acid a,c-diamide adenosyltransferase [Planctomycetes bacterium]|nr:cob(I)yrinic acid a,c-diamide adenosyltransferase [Planctomycetota bacterium]